MLELANGNTIFGGVFGICNLSLTDNMSEMSEGFRHILRSHSFLEETKLDLLEKETPGE
jgi:hypothetical protein